MSNTTRVNDSSRFDAVIKKYHDFYEKLNHTDLADKILADDAVELSHRTLRRYIADYRDRLEKDNATGKAIRESSSVTTSKVMSIRMEDKLPGETAQQYVDRLRKEIEDTQYPDAEEMTKRLDYVEDMIPYDSTSQIHASNYAPINKVHGGSFGGYNTINPTRKSLSIPYSGGNLDGREKTYIVYGCAHMPFHNKKMFNAMLKLSTHLKALKNLTGIVLNGDILDMHSISRHGQNKITLPGWDLQREYNESNKEFDKIDDVFDGMEKVFFYGNHEMWYYDFMSNPNNFKLGQGVVASPEAALKLKERGYQVHNNYKTAHVKMGDLEIIHGDYVNIHAAHAHVSRMKRGVVFAHTHRMGSYTETNVEGYNQGWAGDKNAPVFGYMTRVMKETWRNGFAVIVVDAQGQAHYNQINWKNDKFYFGGIEFN